ncbi:MAG TPA: hypothetical protein VFM56_05450 [Solimonas sp.]|jgi:uncharacterized protein YodC (DUF2158 family)|nr:hypothetical protein [Solimonas sp.]
MEPQFKVGDIVIDREGGMRMKVAAVDKTAGTVRCTWTRGPAKHSRSFSPDALLMRTPKAPAK